MSLGTCLDDSFSCELVRFSRAYLHGARPARARAPAFSGACARCLAVACEDALYAGLSICWSSSLRIGNRRFTIGSDRVDARFGRGDKAPMKNFDAQSGAGEERGKAAFPRAVAPPRHIRVRDEIAIFCCWWRGRVRMQGFVSSRTVSIQ